MIVVTLTKVPPSLRGTLTKWYQEIQTGVFVGSVSARVRDLLWDRIQRDIGNGSATMVYNAKNEFGYQFVTTRKDRQVQDFDGIPLLMRLDAQNETSRAKSGFSDAAKFHKAKAYQRKAARNNSSSTTTQFIALDLETTGLELKSSEIIAIGAAKMVDGQQVDKLDLILQSKSDVPAVITRLTGISTEMTQKGLALSEGLKQLKAFVADFPIVGYNYRFDRRFIDAAFIEIGEASLTNRSFDLMPIIKKHEAFLDNYKLETVLQKYGIQNNQPHYALSDAIATMQLASQLIKNGQLRF